MSSETFEAELAAHYKMLDSLPPACTNVCNECPWRRKAIPGHLGPYDAEHWVEIAQSEAPVACHKTITKTNDDGYGDWTDGIMRQCKGLAIFRRNIFKSPRHPKIAIEPADKETIFGHWNEFIQHHTKGYWGDGTGIYREE